MPLNRFHVQLKCNTCSTPKLPQVGITCFLSLERLRINTSFLLVYLSILAVPRAVSILQKSKHAARQFHICFYFPRESKWKPGCLTNSPLSLVCSGKIEDVYLVTSVWFVIGLNVNGELLNKGTGVSGGQNEIKGLEKTAATRGQMQASGYLVATHWSIW